MAKPLSYSKWDNIELSDDEDIEVHPNIDKASFIRWKQADIHRKREERKLRIQQHRQEHETNAGLLERVQRMLADLRDTKMKAGVAERVVADVGAYERDRKPVLFDPESPEYLQPKSVVRSKNRIRHWRRIDFHILYRTRSIPCCCRACSANSSRPCRWRQPPSPPSWSRSWTRRSRS